MTMKKLFLIFVLSTGIANAQWVPDREEYEVLNEGNFFTTAPDLNTALATALSTLEYNNAKMHTLNINRKDIDAPLFNHFHRDTQPGFVYIVYVARTKTDYVIWFRYLPEDNYEFEEEYLIIEYDSKVNNPSTSDL